MCQPTTDAPVARVWLQSEFGGGLHDRCFGAALIVPHVSDGIVRGWGAICPPLRFYLHLLKLELDRASVRMSRGWAAPGPKEVLLATKLGRVFRAENGLLNGELVGPLQLEKWPLQQISLRHETTIFRNCVHEHSPEAQATCASGCGINSPL